MLDRDRLFSLRCNKEDVATIRKLSASPKLTLEQVDAGEEVELEAREGQLIIRAPRHPRYGWDEQFRAMAERGDDKLLDADAPSLTSWDEKEWGL